MWVQYEVDPGDRLATNRPGTNRLPGSRSASVANAACTPAATGCTGG